MAPLQERLARVRLANAAAMAAAALAGAVSAPAPLAAGADGGAAAADQEAAMTLAASAAGTLGTSFLPASMRPGVDDHAMQELLRALAAPEQLTPPSGRGVSPSPLSASTSATAPTATMTKGGVGAVPKQSAKSPGSAGGKRSVAAAENGSGGTAPKKRQRSSLANSPAGTQSSPALSTAAATTAAATAPATPGPSGTKRARRGPKQPGTWARRCPALGMRVLTTEGAMPGWPVYCLCRSSRTDPPMVGCDHCHDWFHCACVNISEEEADRLPSYTCPSCCAATARPYPYNPLPLDAGYGRIIVKSAAAATAAAAAAAAAAGARGPTDSSSPILSVVGTPVRVPSPGALGSSPLDAMDVVPAAAAPGTGAASAPPKRKRQRVSAGTRRLSAAAAAAPVGLGMVLPAAVSSVGPGVVMAAAATAGTPTTTAAATVPRARAPARRPVSASKAAGGVVPTTVVPAPLADASLVVADMVMPSPDRRDWLPTPATQVQPGKPYQEGSCISWD
jgi:hypothetical protein